MKFYVICRTCREKVYLTFDSQVSVRRDIPPYMNVKCPQCGIIHGFSNLEVYAETDTSDATTGAILGGLIGLLAGPEGALLGAGLGSVLGASHRENDVKAVRRFNNS